MAFAFFRRRQKLVIIIMAVLMVTFLIGFQGFEQLVRRRPETEPIGTGRWDDVLRRDLVQAHGDIELLRIIGLGRSHYQMMGIPTETEFLALMNNDWNEVPLTYALLLKEAEDSGTVSVTDQDVDQFLRDIGLTGAQYERLVAQIGDRRQDGGEMLRGAVARWLTVSTSFNSATTSVLPSEPQLRHAYRNLTEQINLRVGEFRADDLLEELTDEPTDDDILAHYNRYRSSEAGQAQSPEEFGFGYRRPNRIAVSYLFVDRDVVERVAKPSRTRVFSYWREHRDEFVREVPVDNDNEDEPTEYRQEPMTFSEAEPLIIEQLKPETVESQMEALLRRAEFLLDEVSPDSETDPYVRVRRRMARPADATLQREVTVRISRQPLNRAIEILADAADLDAIYYPWGQRGDIYIDPEVEITLPAERTTDAPLEDVLHEITRHALDEMDEEDADIEINWAHSVELENVLFPVDREMDAFPVSAERTELLSLSRLINHEILGNAYTSREAGDGLWRRAFDAEAFRPERGTIREGDTGPRMFVRDDRTGRLLWRLSETQTAHDPPEAETIDDIPADLVEAARRDLKLLSAMDIARGRAEEVFAEAGEDNLAEALEEAGARVFETGLFSRQTYGLEWRGIPQMRAGDQNVLRYMVERAFELAPEKVNDQVEGDSPQKKVLELPPRRSVSVLERIDYRPASRDGYEQERDQVAMLLAQQRIFTAALEWFDSDNVVRRGEFRRARED